MLQIAAHARLGKDPELKQASNGNDMAISSAAVSDIDFAYCLDHGRLVAMEKLEPFIEGVEIRDLNNGGTDG